ncbi:MAG: DsbC family protein [Proteobacteria bacterium]|nr:DsbC family protein [Pseudomonadota bacterium]
MALTRFLIIALLALPVVAVATDAPVSLTAAEAREKLLLARPDLPILGIKQSVLDGYFEITMQGGMTLYMNASADYFIAGDLFFIEPGGIVNATERNRTTQRKRLLARLDETDMVVFAPRPELTKATITVFTDIDCGYCRKLHQEVPELNRLGVAVRYLAYPRAGIGSDSYDKAVSVWCSDNPQKALTNAKSGIDIEMKTCANPVAEQYEMGDAFGVTGTPAVLYDDGTLQAGYLPAAEMASRLGIN